MFNTYVAGGYDPSRPLGSNSAGDPLTNIWEYDALGGAWAVDPTTAPVCCLGDRLRPSGGTADRPRRTARPRTCPTACIQRKQLRPDRPAVTYRGVTFYFTPTLGHCRTSMNIRNRFEMQGRQRQRAGLAFRGVLYAPYDDVKLTGGNGFNTVGQVMAWTAKFNGGSPRSTSTTRTRAASRPTAACRTSWSPRSTSSCRDGASALKDEACTGPERRSALGGQHRQTSRLTATSPRRPRGRAAPSREHRRRRACRGPRRRGGASGWRRARPAGRARPRRRAGAR